MRLRLTPRAEAELVDIAAYLVARSPQAAGRVEHALREAFALIADFPAVGHELREGVRRLALTRYPYLIFSASTKPTGPWTSTRSGTLRGRARLSGRMPAG